MKFNQDFFSEINTGSELELARLKAGITRVKFAELIGVVIKTVHNWENEELLSDNIKKKVNFFFTEEVNKHKKGNPSPRYFALLDKMTVSHINKNIKQLNKTPNQTKEREDEMSGIYSNLKEMFEDKVNNSKLNIDFIQLYSWRENDKHYIEVGGAGAETSRNESRLPDGSMRDFFTCIGILEAMMPMKEKARNRYSTNEMEIVYFKFSIKHDGNDDLKYLFVASSKTMEGRPVAYFLNAIDHYVVEFKKFIQLFENYKEI